MSTSYRYTPSLFSEEHEIFRASYRRFLAEEADAHVDEWLAAGEIPQSFWRKAREQGFLAIGIPPEYGGPADDFFYRVIIAEELGYSVASASIAPAVIGDGVSEIIFHSASEALRHKWMPPMRPARSASASASATPPPPHLRRHGRDSATDGGPFDLNRIPGSAGLPSLLSRESERWLPITGGLNHPHQVGRSVSRLRTSGCMRSSYSASTGCSSAVS